MESITEEEIRKAVEAALGLQEESPEGFTTVEYAVALGLDPIAHPYHRERALREIKVLIRAGKIEPVHRLSRKNATGRDQLINGWRVMKN